MAKTRFPLTILLFVLMLAIGRDSQAVIYKYVSEKGVPTFADDLQKVPDQYRTQAVIVSGGNDYDAYAEQEKARLAAEARARQVTQAAAPVKAEDTVGKRLIRSGVAIGIFIALLLVASHIAALREQAQVLFRIRTVLIVLLVVFLGVTHTRDVMGLIGRVGETVSNPVAGLQERSAERGKKAAEAYKSMDKILDQRAHAEETRFKETERKFDDAERGK